MISVNVPKGRLSILMAGLNCLFKFRDGGKMDGSVHVNLGTSTAQAHCNVPCFHDGYKANITVMGKPDSGIARLSQSPLTLLFYWDSVPNPDAPRGLCVLHVFAVANTRTRPVV